MHEGSTSESGTCRRPALLFLLKTSFEANKLNRTREYYIHNTYRNYVLILHILIHTLVHTYINYIISEIFFVFEVSELRPREIQTFFCDTSTTQSFPRMATAVIPGPFAALNAYSTSRALRRHVKKCEKSLWHRRKADSNMPCLFQMTSKKCADPLRSLAKPYTHRIS